MVGFPGETEADFKELLTFIKAVKFDNMGGIYLFSTRWDTSSPYGRSGYRRNKKKIDITS